MEWRRTEVWSSSVFDQSTLRSALASKLRLTFSLLHCNRLSKCNQPNLLVVIPTKVGIQIFLCFFFKYSVFLSFSPWIILDSRSGREWQPFLFGVADFVCLLFRYPTSRCSIYSKKNNITTTLIKSLCHAERNEVECLSRRNEMKTGSIYSFKISTST